MGNVLESIDDELRDFIQAQQMFFVATAPNEGGNVNMSPKGLDSFAVLGPAEVAYLDLVGSGVETIAHVRENGRITFMFCAFSGKPNIVRLYGRAEVLLPGDEAFEGLRGRFGEFKAVRSIIRADLSRIADSCGYGIPLMTYSGDRRTLLAWADKKSLDDIEDYKRTRNAESIDGLPGI